MKYYVFLLMIFSLLPLNIYATGSITTEEAKHEAEKLKTAKNPQDSIKILYDVMDLTDSADKNRVGLKILEVARKSNNQEVLVDILTRLASTLDDVDALSRLLAISSQLPDSEKKSVEVVLEMESANKDAKKISDDEREGKLLDYAVADKSDKEEKEDIYQEILATYRPMVLLGVSSQGSLYQEYITHLEKLVDRLPDSEFGIKNLYYTTAAVFYTRKRNYKKAIESDRALVRQMQLLEEHIRKMGRSHHNFDYLYYVSYRRMLENYPGLTPQEIEDLYAKCIELAEKSEEVAKAFGNGGRSKSYYYMAKKEYAKAIPELRKALATDELSDFRRMEITGLLAEALEATGNDKELLPVLKTYNQMLLNERSKRVEDAIKEMEIRESVNEIIAQQKVEQEKLTKENRKMRKISITLVYILAVLLILLCSNYFKLRRKVKELDEANLKLHRNIEHIFDDGEPFGATDLRKSQKDKK